jgi:hypothetical protein
MQKYVFFLGVVAVSGWLYSLSLHARADAALIETISQGLGGNAIKKISDPSGAVCFAVMGPHGNAISCVK